MEKETTETFAPDTIIVFTNDAVYSTDSEDELRRIEPFSFEYWEGGMGGVKFLVKNNMIVIPYSSINYIEHARN